jgi:ankyrin repeat protein
MMDAFEAIEANDLERFCKLVNRDNVNMLHRTTRSLIRTAMQHNRIDFIEYLIQTGADVNYANTYWWAPLYIAVERDDTKITEILLNAGADVRCTNPEGRTPLGAVIMYNRNIEYVKLLIDRGAYQYLSDFDRAISNYTSKSAAAYNEWRSKFRRSIIALIAVHKQKKGSLWFSKQDKHIIQMIGKHAWSLRMLEQTSP